MDWKNLGKEMVAGLGLLLIFGALLAIVSLPIGIAVLLWQAVFS